jgi:hypothetical protein
MKARTREARDRERTELARAEGRELLSWVQGTPRISGGERFDIESDGSGCLQQMYRRLQERAYVDEDGVRAFEALLALEKSAVPLFDACVEYLERVGRPEAEEWDPWEEVDDWRDLRW